MKEDKNPTREFYELFQYIYDYLNDNLFRKELPNCMIVITRKNKVFGYFSPERWINKEKIQSDEIAINPQYFTKYPLLEILQTMVHEMCHLWQHHFGKPSQRTYHNKEWAEKMISVGLMPSNTGKEGGKTTGQHMADYAIKDGIFMNIADKMIRDEGFKNLWYDRRAFLCAEIAGMDLPENLDPSLVTSVLGANLAVKPQKTRLKYSCPSCGTNIWGKKELNIVCGNCEKKFELTE
jgi:predicted SprT family Zn-dependent metalloprotease